MKTLLTSFAAFTLLLAVVESGAPEQPSHRSKLVVRCDPEASIAHISVGDDPPLIVMYNGEGVRILRVPEAFKFQVQLDRKTKERTFDLIWFEKRAVSLILTKP